MSLFLVLYVLAICGATAAFVYGLVRPERPRRGVAAVRPLDAPLPSLKRPRRLAA